MTTWIVVADSSRARIFETPERGREIHEIEDFVNPSARGPDRDLQTGADGRFHTKYGTGKAGHTVAPKIDPGRHEAELFAKRVGEYVDKARAEVRYDKLCLVAPPGFLGLLRGNLGKESRKLMQKEFAKDLSQLAGPAILAYVKGERKN
jgi:protein required for attachment to host cells